MATRANSSRERILGCAEAIILQKGYTGTSIEEIIDSASITKGGFFYHFDGKSGLAEALVDRYLAQDRQLFDSLFAKAENLSEDPLHRLLIFLRLLAEVMGEMETTHPGCLVATFTYENLQFKEELRRKIRSGYDSWRAMIAARLEDARRTHDMNTDVSIEALADMFTSIIEGGILLSRAYSDNGLLVNQILAYRSFIRRIFGAT